MNYPEALRFIFKSPRWGMNLLFISLGMLVPIAGPMVVIGYCTEVFAELRRTNGQSYPDFDMQKLTYYFSRGLYPFLVAMVMNLALMPIFMCCCFPSMMIGPAFSRNNGAVGFVFMCIGGIFYLLAALVLGCIATPVVLRAILLQDFAKSFNLAFVRDFTSRVGLQLVIMHVVALVLGITGALVGTCLCIVGVYPITAMLILMHYHLYMQLYAAYLERGGEVLAVKTGGAFEVQPPRTPAS